MYVCRYVIKKVMAFTLSVSLMSRLNGIEAYEPRDTDRYSCFLHGSVCNAELSNRETEFQPCVVSSSPRLCSVLLLIPDLEGRTADTSYETYL